MKSKKNFPAKEMDVVEFEEGQYAESEKMTPEEHTDRVSTLRRCVTGRGHQESAGFAYWDPGADDYIDEQALHRIVEDLQFGHDLRL